MTLGAHHDPLNETEPTDTIYTLTVHKPPRPPHPLIPSIFTRTPVTHPNSGASYTIKPDNFGSKKPNYDDFDEDDLADMPTKVVKLKAWQFPLRMRCEHVQPDKKCDEGCYVLEKGGDVRRWRCKREDCEGHVYSEYVLTDEKGVACFGKKGERLVCAIRTIARKG
jgi:hypothetical protein